MNSKTMYYRSVRGHIYKTTTDNRFTPYDKDDQVVSEKDYLAYEQITLRDMLDRESVDTIWTLITWCNRDGTSRRLRLYVVMQGEICNITSWAISACKMKSHDAEIVLSGSRYHFGQAAVEALSWALYGKADHFQYRDM